MSNEILSDEGMRILVSEALMKSLGEEQRNALITQAIKNLMTPAKPQYGQTGTTPLEDAFRDGVVKVAHEIINEKLVNDPDFKSKIAGVVTDATTIFLETNRDETVQQLARSLGEHVKFNSARY